MIPEIKGSDRTLEANMVKFKFFVNCSYGGYENTHFANSAKEAKARVAEWNKDRPGSVDLISIEEISDAEFAEDFVGII